MLPLWPNQLLVTLSATHVALLYRTGLAKKVLAQRAHTVTPNPEHIWQASVQTLEHLLVELAVPRQTAMHVTLESDLVRYLVLPPTLKHISAIEKTAYAQAAFREIFGAEVQHWDIQCDDVAPSQPTMCAAIDQTLRIELQTIAEKHFIALKSIQPYFVRAFNGLASTLHKADGMVAMVEHSRLVLATFQHGVCIQIRTQAITADWQQQLPELLARTLALDEEVTRVISIYAPAHKTSTFTPIQHWQIKRLGLTKKQSLPHSTYPLLEVMA